MTLVKTQALMVEFIKPAAVKGSAQVGTINVERDGKPFGQIWTYKCDAATWHPYHAKLVSGLHQTFWNANQTGGDLGAAKAWMVEQARAV